MADLSPDDLVPMQLGTLVGRVRGRCRCRCWTRRTTPATASATVPDEVDARAGRAGRLLHGRRQPARQGAAVPRRRRRPRRGRAAAGAGQGPVRPRADGDDQPRATRTCCCLGAAGPLVAGRRVRARSGRASTTPGKGWTPRIPSAILETNDGEVYAALPARPVRGRRHGRRRRAVGVHRVPSVRRRAADAAADARGWPRPPARWSSGLAVARSPGAAAQRRPRPALRRADRLPGPAQERAGRGAGLGPGGQPRPDRACPGRCGTAGPGQGAGVPEQGAVVAAPARWGAPADRRAAVPDQPGRAAGVRARIPVRAGGQQRRRRRAADVRPVGAGQRDLRGRRLRQPQHHRLHDGLRHHRHRAGLLAGQVQEAGRRRVDADRQPDDPAGAEAARLRRARRPRRSSSTSPSTGT